MLQQRSLKNSVSLVKSSLQSMNINSSKSSYEIYKCLTQSGKDYGFGASNPNVSSFGHTNSAQSFNPLKKNRPFNSFYRSYSDIPSRNKAYEQSLFTQSYTGVNFDKYDDIPVTVNGEKVEKAMENFKSLDLGEAINLNIELCGFAKPTPIQKHSIPNLLTGIDMMACAQTGSGKTAAYLLPIVYRISESYFKNSEFIKPAYECQEPYALIVAPTRELVQQIEADARKLSYRTNVKVATAFGGVSVQSQIGRIMRGCDILIATPGRLIDFLGRSVLTLKNTKYLVFDEADRMLDMGFDPQIRMIMTTSRIPPKKSRQTVMFSATFPPKIRELARDFLNNEVHVTIGKIGAASDTIKQKIENVREHEKLNKLKKDIEEIRKANPNSHILVFVQRKDMVDDIECDLYQSGHRVVSIHGDRSQLERDQAIMLFKKKEAYIMVATDVAQRGLDIPSVSHVINFSMPSDVEDYVHRIGRTGRVGNEGVAISYFNDTDSSLAANLITHLEENKQEVPQFLIAINRNSLYKGFSSNNRRGFKNDRWNNRNYYK